MQAAEDSRLEKNGADKIMPSEKAAEPDNTVFFQKTVQTAPSESTPPSEKDRHSYADEHFTEENPTAVEDAVAVKLPDTANEALPQSLEKVGNNDTDVLEVRFGKDGHFYIYQHQKYGRYIDAVEFGADSTGKTDSLAAINNALAAAHQEKVAVRLSGKLYISDQIVLNAGIRFDHHDQVGANWSPSINLSHTLAQGLTLKAGVARAYKAPNLYQLNPNYLLYSRGIGCWGGGGACYLQGNADLKAETSINKELGIEYTDEQLLAGLTLFHNDYRDKIEAGHTITGRASGGSGRTANAAIFRWANVPKAVVSGVEGAFNINFTPALQWSNNLTYMIDSENKETGEQLSIIPKYTLNSRLGWQASSDLEVFGTVTWYGRQKANRYDFQGLPLTGEEAQSLSPYGLLGIGAKYAVTRHLSIGAGIDNLLDKRLYRRGNAVGVNNPRTIYGAGAATYNEPGRSFYLTVSGRF